MKGRDIKNNRPKNKMNLSDKELVEYRKMNYWRGFWVGSGLVFIVGVIPLVVVLHKIYQLALTLE